MNRVYESKHGLMGPLDRHEKELLVLNRKIRWEKGGISIEADTKHVTEAVKALGLEGAKPVVTPAVRDVSDLGKPGSSDGGKSDENGVGPDGRYATMVGGSGMGGGDSKELVGDEATLYRSVTARFLYLSQDRPDTVCGEGIF